MEQTDQLEASIHRVAISLVIFGLGLLSTIFVVSTILFIREMGEEGPSVSGSASTLILSITKILPLTIALAAALIMLSKGLDLLFRLKELAEEKE